MSVVTVTVSSDNEEMPAAYELVTLDTVHAVNRIAVAELVLLDGDAARQNFAISDAAFFEPGKPVTISARYEGHPDEESVLFQGVVIAQTIEARAQYSLLRVSLKDPAVALTRTRKNAIYKEMTDSDILAAIARENGLDVGTIAETDTEHQQMVQYQCSDWDFMLSRAEGNGLLVVAVNGEISAQVPEIKESADHTLTYGIDPIVEIEMTLDGERQVTSVNARAWDVAEQTLTDLDAEAYDLHQGNLRGEQVADALGLQPGQLLNGVPLPQAELQTWADATLMRSRLALVRGRIGIEGQGELNLLETLALDGIGERFNGNALITGVRHQIDIDGWRTDIQVGLTAQRCADLPNVIDVPAAGLLPGVRGLQIGVVDSFESDPDKEFRVRVRVPALHAVDQPIWARLVTPDAGPDRGYFFFPEPGDEVVLAFLNNDPRHAVILGSLFSSKNPLPECVADLGEKNIDKAIVTRSGIVIGFKDDDQASVYIETPAGNLIHLSDADEALTVEDQHGNQIILNDSGITLNSVQDFQVEAQGNITLKGSAIDVQ